MTRRRVKPKIYTTDLQGKKTEQVAVENAVRDIAESKKLPFNLSELVDQVDYEYSTVQGASYLLPVPANTLSPDEHQNILEASELTAVVYQAQSIKTTEPTNPNSFQSSKSSRYLQMRDVAIVSLVAMELLEDESHRGPNAIPLAIIRLRDADKQKKLHEPVLSLVRNIISSHAQSLTLQGYEINVAQPKITPDWEETDRLGRRKPKAVPFHERYDKQPFIPGNFVVDSEADEHQVYMVDHGTFARQGLRCPLCRYEDAMAFLYAAVETPTLLHEDLNYQRFYLARMAQAAMLVKDGTTSFGHLGDYILSGLYENCPFNSFESHRACNQSKFIMTPDAEFVDDPNPIPSPREQFAPREEQAPKRPLNKVQQALEKQRDYSAEQAEDDFWNGFCRSVQSSIEQSKSESMDDLNEKLLRLKNQGLIE